MARYLANDWKQRSDSLERVKSRPKDYHRLMLSCLVNGMTIRDVARVFGVSERNVNMIKLKYSDISTPPDREYFMDRALKLGATRENVQKWFSK